MCVHRGGVGGGGSLSGCVGTWSSAKVSECVCLCVYVCVCVCVQPPGIVWLVILFFPSCLSAS